MSSAPSSSATALGGDLVPVTYKDGSTGSVLVRELEIDPGLLTFMGLAIKEAECVEFACDRPAGWAATLKPTSLLDLHEKALALNFTNAERWAQNRLRVVQNLQAGGLLTVPPSTSSAPAPA